MLCLCMCVCTCALFNGNPKVSETCEESNLLVSIMDLSLSLSLYVSVSMSSVANISPLGHN